MKFNDNLVASRLDELKAIEFDRYFVTDQQIEEVSRLLELDKTQKEDDLRAVRNSVVKLLAEEMSEARKAEKYADYDKLQNSISAITAVIDGYLWHLGFAV